MKKFSEFIKAVAVENNLNIMMVSVFSAKEGITNYTAGKGMSKNTALNAGEMTQLVLCLLTASLVERGSLTLSDKVSDILEKYPDNGVKVIDLLAHTAGYNTENFEKTLPKNPTEDDYLTAFYEYNSPECGNGKNPEFFSQGYILIAEIIEKLSKRSIEQFAKEVLYSPLNMRNTTFDGRNLDSTRYRLTDNYTKEEFKRGGMRMYNHMLTTAEDLTKMISLLINDGKYQDRQVISKPTIRMIKRVFINEIAPGYGGLFMRKDYRADDCIGDLNSETAYCFKSSTGAVIMVDEEDKVATAVLTVKSEINNSIYRKINSKIMRII